MKIYYGIDSDNNIIISDEKLVRDIEFGIWGCNGKQINLPDSILNELPKICWLDEPLELEISFKPSKEEIILKEGEIELLNMFTLDNAFHDLPIEDRLKTRIFLHNKTYTKSILIYNVVVKDTEQILASYETHFRVSNFQSILDTKLKEEAIEFYNSNEQ